MARSATAAASFGGCVTSAARAAYFAALHCRSPSRGRRAQRTWADRAKERLFRAPPRRRSDVRRSRILQSPTLRVTDVTGSSRAFNWHLQGTRRGHRLGVAELYVDVVAEICDTSGALGTRLAVDARKLTGSYLGRNCRGREKLRRLNEWIDREPPGDALYAYGNSRGDRRMLRGARSPTTSDAWGLSGPCDTSRD